MRALGRSELLIGGRGWDYRLLLPLSRLVCRGKREQGKGKGRGRGKRDKGSEAPHSPSGADLPQRDDGDEFDSPAVVRWRLAGHLLHAHSPSPPPQNGASAPDEEVWSVDTSEEAVKARMDKLSEQASALALTSDLEKKASERVDLFYKFVEVCNCMCRVSCVTTPPSSPRPSRTRAVWLLLEPLCPASRSRRSGWK